MTYILLELDNKEYKYSLTFDSFKRLEMKFNEAFTECLTKINRADVLEYILFVGLQKYHSDEFKQLSDLNNKIDLKRYSYILNILNQHLNEIFAFKGGNENNKEEGKSLEKENS